MAQRLGLLLCAAAALLHAEAWHPLYSIIRGPVQGVTSIKHCQVCSTWGKYRFLTFDGNLFQLKSDCNYLFASSCSSSSKHQDFSVQIRRGTGKGGRPIIVWVLLVLDGVSVELSVDDVKVNGNPCNLPFTYSGVRVERTQAYIRIRANMGLKVLWCTDSLLLELDSKYRGETCGLCGDFNGEPLSEFISHGIKMTLKEFANLWRKDNPLDICPDIAPEPTPSICDHVRPMCERILRSPAFSSCHALLDVDSFINACRDDACYCTLNPKSDCICDTLTEFSRQCVYKGGHPGPWRTKKLCWKPCPPTMEHMECANPVMDTCSNPEASSTSDEPCMDGCFCPQGTVHDDLTGKGCIPVTECSCSYNGNLYAPGTGYSSKCNKCVCNSGQWECTEVSCPGVCSLTGGAHINTFDGKDYTFHGDCTYTLAKDCKSEDFVIQVALKQCGSSETQTCLKEIVLALSSGQVLTIKSCGEVLVNGMYPQIPLSSGGLRVVGASSFFILIYTSVGVHLWVQLKPVMQLYVIVQSEHWGHMCGLCGNFNGNQADDFMKLSGVLDATGTGFANSWKTSASCLDVWPLYKDPCSDNKVKEKFAERWCGLLTDPKGVFAPCHSTVCPASFKQRCIYDSCNCENSERCMCAAVSSYVYACSLEGVHIKGWRNVVCGKYKSCPEGMVYSDSIVSSPKTCRCRFATDNCCHLSFEPLDGCVCVPGTILDNTGKCVPERDCPCYHNGEVVPSGEKIHLKNGVCKCEKGELSCVGIPPHIDPPVKCSYPMIYFNCSDYGVSAKGKECEESCSTFETACLSSGCVSGCICPPGTVSDDHNKCVKPQECPCIHNGIKYAPGETIKVDCNTCTCQNRQWHCTLKDCDSSCWVYGSGHYKTFDDHRFHFAGNCEYIMLQDYCEKSKGSFKILTENVPCGTGGGSCSKIIKIYLKGSELILTQGSYDLKGSASPFSFSTVGLYLVIEINNGITLIWNRKSFLMIRISQSHKGHLCGLCGNLDGIANNDQTTCCGAVEVNPVVFGNSWKNDPSCPDVSIIPNPCLHNPDLSVWAHKRCGVIYSSVFAPCHYAVDPSPYHDACVFDTCSCDPNGDIDLLCTAVAAYAEACNQVGICVEWRNAKFCPITCDVSNLPGICEWNYKACGDPCLKTCRNPSGLCRGEIPPLEGCYPECPPYKPYFDEVALICVTREECGCYDSEGNHYNESDKVPTSENCVVCTCLHSAIHCDYSAKDCKCEYHGVLYSFGTVLYNTNDGHGTCFIALCGLNGTIHRNTYPCPSIPPAPIPTFLPSPPCGESGTDCYWTSWINSDKPTVGMKDDETIHRLMLLGYKVCEHPVEVECRAVHLPYTPISEVGQTVTCNAAVGFLCLNYLQHHRRCYDYEIRMKCCPECPTKPPCNTTTATTPCHPTPPPTTTICDHGPTTLCPGEWSEWFDLNDPTGGPHGGETELIAHLIYAGKDICSHPEAIECRPKRYGGFHYYHYVAKQDIVCDKNIGLVCHNSKKQKCYDYEIRVYCCEGTTTHHCDPTTTATTPCHPTPPPTTTICDHGPTTLCPGEWSEWFDLNDPTGGPHGGETELIAHLIWAGKDICSHPEAIECRPKWHRGYHYYHYVAKQDIVCDKNIGLVCHNSKKQKCYDYEIRVYCCEGTTTPHCDPTTTATTPCHPTPPPTMCPGEWSEWFDLNDPTGGPHGGETELIAHLIFAGKDICSHPEAIECRPKRHRGYHYYHYITKQDIVCDKNIGLVCHNSKNQKCYDYEIRVYCCEGTTTHHCDPTTTATTPCHPTPPPTTTICDHGPTTLCPGEWSEWFDLNDPTGGPHGGETELIAHLIYAGKDICSHPEAIECRPKRHRGYHYYHYITKQDIVCDKNIGLVCHNSKKQKCYDYEIRVYCCEGTTTHHCDPTTTATTPCHPTPPPTLCPGEWSEWFDLNDPTGGPHGGETELIAHLIFAGKDICSHPEAIECRPKWHRGYHHYHYITKQDIVCDKNIGLVCHNSKKQKCYDYEIRVYCCEGTTTHHCDPTTTATTPCHPTPPPTTTICDHGPTTLCPGEWSEWFDLNDPTGGPHGGETELIAHLIFAGKDICSHPEAIECRPKRHRGYHYYHYITKQDIVCDKNIGLVCHNSKKQKCYDYEIRVYCCEGTTTPHCDPTTTATTPCHPTPPPTLCPGEWSGWFDLNDPTGGPHGGETELIAHLIFAGKDICSHPEAIECRPKWHRGYHYYHYITKQDIVCDKNIGLVCHNSKKQKCYDYEIRVYCCEGTTTHHCDPTTTATTPCHPTPPPTTTICDHGPTTLCPGEWSEWFDLNDPTGGPHGGETELIAHLIWAGKDICSHPEAIECRPKRHRGYHYYHYITKQDIVCDKNIGLVCHNSKKQKCYDYEIRVYCCEGTTTPHCDPTTTATTPCHPTPPPTLCPGEWSGWFDLNDPTGGPHGGETELIAHLIFAGKDICSHPEAIECRPKWHKGYHHYHYITKQDIVCDKNIGLVCHNSKKQKCYDYEIRVYCCEGTTTHHCDPTTTATTPCHPTPPPTTTICDHGPTTLCPGEWSEWFDLNDPTGGPHGGETELIAHLIFAGKDICSHPEAIECRPKRYGGYHHYHYMTKQDIVCDKNIGLVCHNSKKQKCYDYEIRVYCCEGTTTHHCDPTTTATTPCHPTPPPTTTTCDHAPTTECQGGEDCYWSRWYDLNDPTGGYHGGDIELIHSIINAGYPICLHPVAIECRAKLHPLWTPAMLGQVITCHKDIGLVCKNYLQPKKRCLDYEIRVKCCKCKTTTLCHSTTPSTTCHDIKTTSTTCSTERVDKCYCIYRGIKFPPGSIVYNYTDHKGYCYVGSCSPSCDIVVSHEPCVPTVKPGIDCLYLRPPRRHGETWKKGLCRLATCDYGKVKIIPILCPEPKPVRCANNLPPVKVFDENGCCFHYECQCLCYGWGDPNQLTFDGRYYNFHGKCSYWLVKEMFPRYDFNVMVTNGECGTYSTCVESITVFYKGYKIYFTQLKTNDYMSNLVLVNGKTINCAYKIADLQITTTGITTMLLIPSIGAKITFSVHSYSINLPFHLFNSHTHGQCGKCNNNRQDDCIVPGTYKDSCQEMAHEWHTHDKYCEPPEPPPRPPPCDNSICDIMTTKSGVFEDCHGVVNFQDFYTACQHDVHNTQHSSGACSSLQTYALACAQAGVCIDWRSETYGVCDYTCPSPKVYEPCGPAVELTCDFWFNNKYIYNNKNFTAMIQNQEFEGCYCPKGTTLLSAYSNECVPSCQMCRMSNGTWKHVNDEWISGCDLCRCEENNDEMVIVCQPKKCPPVPVIICNLPGQVLNTDTVDCCPRPRCECDKTQCTPIPSCPLGMKLVTIVGVCCDKYDCVPKRVCVFNNREFEVGDVVPRFPCETCTCCEKTDPETSLHILNCVSMTCDTHCAPGYEYQQKTGECCGKCVQIGCYVSLPSISHLLLPGEEWSPPNDPCVKFKCTQVGNQFVTVEAQTSCPPFDPKECIPGTETVDAGGCCKVCVSRSLPCALTSAMEVLEVDGCKSLRPVNMTSCRGACGTFTFFSMRIRALHRSCSCCQEVSTSERKVTLICPDRSKVPFVYTHIEACACLTTRCPAPVPPYKPLPVSSH